MTTTDFSMSDTVAQILERLQQVTDRIDIHEDDLTPIQQFYSNSHIFITGFTGLLGTILVEKLLRSCPVSTLYLLVRSKKGKDASLRVDEIFADPLFQVVRKQNPNFRDKIVAVEGDCLLPDLGLNPQDQKMLIDKVDIIFHAAATVRFDEKLKTAVDINIRASRDILRLAHQLPKLKCFVHVSTAYANCTFNRLEERIYPPAMDYELLISMTKELPDTALENITPGLLDKYPNTYIYTKQIAEDVVRQESRGLPVGVYKPAIVVSTYKEPLRGWINNIYGPTGVVAGAGLGLLRLLYCDPKCKANIIPVDMCVNALLAVAWDIGEQYQRAKKEKLTYDIPVYNFESTNDKPIDWDSFKNSSSKYGTLTPTMRSVWYYSFRICKYYYLFLVLNFFLHTIPCTIADVVLCCMGKELRMKKIYDKIYKMNTVLSYFNTKDWDLETENVKKIINKMTDRDRTIFYCDIRELDWEEFFKTYIPGARQYVVKENWDTLPKAVVYWNRLYWLHQLTKAILGLLLLWILWSLYCLILKLIT